MNMQTVDSRQLGGSSKDARGIGIWFSGLKPVAADLDASRPVLR
jgi:hypothetical protein